MIISSATSVASPLILVAAGSTSKQQHQRPRTQFKANKLNQFSAGSLPLISLLLTVIATVARCNYYAQAQQKQLVIKSPQQSGTLMAALQRSQPAPVAHHHIQQIQKQKQHQAIAQPIDSSFLLPNGASNMQQLLIPPPPGSDEICGLNMKELRHERIVGGRSASYAEVPFIIHLRESQLFRVLGYNKCGGVLINHRWALTAAHCKPAFFSSLEIILGKHKTFEDALPPEGSAMASIVKLAGKSFSSSKSSSDDSSNEIDTDSASSSPVASIGQPSSFRKQPVLQVLADTVIVHPNYDSKTLENDLALIKIKHPVPFREDIQPICLPAFNEDFTGLDGYATGWGLTDFDKRQLPDTLQIVRLPIMSNKRCQSMYKKAGHEKEITEMDLCAGYAKGGMDACEGDSGGPLIVRRPDDHRWTLAGIVSNGVKCGEPLLPGVYTRVSRFVPWILEQMRTHA